MKLFSFIICLIITNYLFSQKEHEPFTGDVLTIGVKGLENCHPPGSTVRSVGGGNIEKVIEKTGARTIGTAFIYQYKNTNYLITCEHVIFRASEIYAYDSNYKQYELEWVGEDTFYDLSVLKFKKKKVAKQFKSVELEIELPNSGEIIWSVGYWNIDGSINKVLGEVQQTNFTFSEDNIVAGKIKFIETNTTFQKGFSGGPSYNKAGKVVGMNTKRYNGYIKSFALQSKELQRVIHQIVDNGGVIRAFTGLRFSQAKDTTKAVTISAVLNHSPTASFKVKILDSEVQSINQNPVHTIFDILNIMEEINPGDKIEIEFEDIDSNISLVADTLTDNWLKEIACYAIREDNAVNKCIDIFERENQVIVILDDDKEMPIETIGYRLNEKDFLIYCLNDLVQFGTLTRLLGLYGRLEVDDQINHFSPMEIELSPKPEERILYY